MGFLGGSVVKNPPVDEGDQGSIPGSGRSPGGGNGNPLQYPCLEYSTERRVWWGHKEWDTTEWLNNNHNHNTPTQTARIQGTDDVKCWQGCEAPGTLTHCWWECNMVRPHGRQLGSFSQNSTYFYYVCMLVAQLCPTLCDPTDHSPPGSSVHGTFQARILEWVAIPFSRESSQPRDQTQVSHTAGRFFNVWATREAHMMHQLGSKVFTQMSWKCLSTQNPEQKCLQ